MMSTILPFQSIHHDLPNRHSGLTWLILLVLFLPMIAACGEKAPSSHVEKQARFHLNNLTASAVNLGKSFKDIARAKRLNTPARMQETAAMVEQTESLLARADRNMEIYDVFISDHEKRLAANQLNDYILVRDLLNQDLKTKRKAMATCLISMNNWLEFASGHFEQIRSGDGRSRRNYDALFFRLSKSFAKYEAASRSYHRSVQHFLSRHPGIKQAFKTQYKTMKKELGWP